MQTEPSLVTAAYKDQLWEMALQQVITTMNAHFVRFIARYFPKYIGLFYSSRLWFHICLFREAAWMLK